MEILSALCTPAIISNEKAWDSIDNKILRSFEDLSNKVCSDDNYQEYHNVLKSTPNPCVPFLGVHVGDIRFIDDFNQTEIVDTYNMDKLHLLSKEIYKLQALQGSEYRFPANLEFRNRFIENFCHISTLQPTFQEFSSSTPERLKILRDRYENYYGESNILGKEEFNFSSLQLRTRDWSVLTTSSQCKNFKPDEIIYEQETKQSNTIIAFLKSGTVSFKRCELILRTVEAPIIIGALGILNAVDTSFQVISESECTVEFVETRLLVSLLESDSHLSLRFFTQLSFELIKHIHNTASLRADGERSVRLRRSARVSVTSDDIAVSPRLLNRHLVVKPASVQSNPSLSVDTKATREKQFRKLFDFEDDEVLIKGLYIFLCILIRMKYFFF